MRFISFNIGVALLVLIIMEGVGEGYHSWRERAKSAAFPVDMEQRYELDPGADQSWVREYFREETTLEEEWSPYVYWRTKPHHGKHVNINEAGLRRVWNGTPSPAPGQLKVLMFGGSTLWGVGARDDFTIPSFVSRMLTTQLDTGAWVTSLAESGHTSTQEVIALMLALQKGNVPDVVVFFDGVNDSFSALQNRVAGLTENESNRVAEFNSLKRFTWRQAIEHLALYKTIAARARRHVGAPPVTDALARAVVDVYLQNISIVDALAKRFGFRTFFFWQPTVFSKKHLSQREQQWYGAPSGTEFMIRGPGRLLWGNSASILPKAYDAFRERIRTNRPENVYDLSGVFDEVGSTIFIDEWHIMETGNEKIAEQITQVLSRELVRGGRR